MKYFFNDLPEEIFQPMQKYLELIFTDDAQDNWKSWQSDQTIGEWINTFNELADITHTPFVKEELL